MDERLERNIVLALEAKKASLAMSFIKEAFEQDCECAMIQVYLGILNEIENHQAKAMRHYRAALALDGTNDLALYNMYRLGDGHHEPIRFR